MVSALQTPFPFTSNGTPLYVATHWSLVWRWGWICSQIFFLGLSSFSGSPGKPSKVILSPGTAPGGGARISTFSGELAHITIAWDTTPLIFAGFKLQSSIAIRFCIWSRGTCFTKPLTTVLGLASPTSTSSTYRASASGCFLAVIMQPTRRSRRETSTGFASLLPAAGCCFFSFLSPITCLLCSHWILEENS